MEGYTQVDELKASVETLIKLPSNNAGCRLPSGTRIRAHVKVKRQSPLSVHEFVFISAIGGDHFSNVFLLYSETAISYICNLLVTPQKL